ncbi:YgaP family membrane protein [Massilia cavernae]|nr:DUF2892 domain-containing protein [Massilia cavernae]
MNLESNVGGVDRVVRIGGAIILAGLAIFGDLETVWKAVCWIFAAYFAVTAGIGYCPINTLFGIDSSGRETPIIK